jgi:hypothetical protein
VTIEETANHLQISNGSAYEIHHNGLGFHKVGARWVPKQHTMLHEQMQLDICQQHLERYGNESDAFSDKIITDDETWIRHCKPESKLQSIQCIYPQSPRIKNFKRQPTSGKLMLIVLGLI